MGSCGDRSEAGREGDSELEMVANFKVEPMKQIANIAIGTLCLLGLCGTLLVAQNVAQNQAPSASQSTTSATSLGEYARQVRKDSGPSAKPRVFDNDNLPKEDQLSIVGTPTPADSTAENKSDGSANSATTETKPAGEKTSGEAKTAESKSGDKSGDKNSDKNGAKDAADKDKDKDKQAAWKQWGEKITNQQQQIDLLGRELDVLQREYKLRAAEMYADAGNRLRNSADWDKQDAQYKQQLADKQQALDDAKQALDDLQEQARKAGVPSSVREP
jgi:hypothetical protein